MKKALVFLLSPLLFLAASLGARAQQPDGGPPKVLTLQAFASKDPVAAGSKVEIAVVAEIGATWHINSHTPKEDYLIPTELKLAPASGIEFGPVTYPAHEEKKFTFSEQPVAVYEGKTVFRLTGTVASTAAPGPTVIKATLAYQSCNDQQCLPPAETTAELTLNLAAAGTAEAAVNQTVFPQATASAEAKPGAAASQPDPFAGKSLLLILGIVFISGLALNLTPCVYPLIPITLGFFGRQAAGKASKRATLAIAYVLGMSVTYSVLGVVAALSGSLFGAWLQKPAVLIGIAAIVLALALSMFGLFEIQVPHFITDKAQGRSGVLGAGIMGLFVGFVAAPCIGPFVLSLLTYVAEQKSAALGFGLFFTLAMGLGLPYLILGIATTSIQKLPRSGEWMVAIRKVFGFVLVALAVYFLRALIPEKFYGYLLAAPLVVGGLYFLAFEKAGANLSWFRSVKVVLGLVLLAGGVYAGWPVTHAKLPFQPYSDNAVAEAKAAGKPVMIDFYADWCLPCKELDEKTFSDPKVAEALSGWVLLKGDLTKTSETVDAVKKQWDIKGVPTIVFLGPDGKEKGERVVGFEPPVKFLTRLR
ncbi:MAG: thioredoxin family protein [Thermoanaerobaculia bacterium]|nr:thioredoxin family protein [Thermoanaerobaculia bacterium]